MNEVCVKAQPRSYLSAYLELCKCRVVSLIMITALVGMCLATVHPIPLTVLILGNIGIALAASSAAVINHVVDQEIDRKMHRTQRRPLVKGVLSTRHACFFALVLGVLSMFILIYWINVLTAVLTFVTLMGYAVVYTLFLKHSTSQNIVIGGLAGAAPPLLGWVAVTGTVDPQALLLTLIIFVWTPPHFWALAIHRVDDYAKAKVPMLPNTHGIAYTKLNISMYTVLLVVATILPYVIGMLHAVYLWGALLLDAVFVYYVCRLQFSSAVKWPLAVFRYSIMYLFLLFIVMLTDHYLGAMHTHALAYHWARVM